MSANIVSKIQVPDGSIYEIKPTGNPNINTDGIYFVKVTGDSSSVLNASLDGLSEYYEGLKVVLYYNRNEQSTDNVTLNLNGKGPRSIKRYGSTFIEPLNPNSITYLCYTGNSTTGNFVEDTYADSDSIYDLHDNLSSISKIVVNSYPISANSMFMFNTDGKATPFVQTAVTSNASIIPSSIKFVIGSKIFTGVTISADSSVNNISNIKTTGIVDLRYSAVRYNTTLIPANTYNKVYMPISINPSTGVFNLKTESFTAGSGTSNTNFTTKNFNTGSFYMFIGHSSEYNGSGINNNIMLEEEHPIYYYDGINLISYEQYLTNTLQTSINLIDGSIALIDGSISLLDNSVNIINTSIGIIDNSINLIDGSISLIDGSISLFNTSLGILDVSVKRNSVYYAQADVVSATKWNVTIPLPNSSSYFEGLKLVVYNPSTNDASSNLTINVNNIGDVSVYRYSTTGGVIKAKSISYMCYAGGAFRCDNYINTEKISVNFDNPVAGSGDYTPKAAIDISAGDFVYYDRTMKGLVPLRYILTSLEEVSMDIFYDWGLAYCKSNCSTGEYVTSESLCQQCTVPIRGIDTSTNNNEYLEIYAFFDSGGQIVPADNVNIQNSVVALNSNAIGHISTDSNVSQFIYVGLLDRKENMLYVDLSDHNFLKLSKTIPGVSPVDVFNTIIPKTNNVTAINGYLINGGGSGPSTSNYDNPVSGAGDNHAAAMDISAGSFVYFDTSFNGIVPLRSMIGSQTNILYDWGLAYCIENVSSGTNIPEGTLLQQCTVDVSVNTGNKSMPLYAFFDTAGMPVDVSAYCYGIIDGMVAETTDNGKAVTYIYVGWWEHDKVHIDLSNHDFITVNDTLMYNTPYSNTNKITAINNHTFASADLLNGQIYGICNDYDMGGVTPRSGEESGSGTGPWTALATTTMNFEPTSGNVVAIYFTDAIDFYSGAYMNINNTGAYPIYYMGSPVGRGDIASSSVAVFMFDGFIYHLIAGGASNDASINVNLFERKANKVTSLSANSTDTQYPSAKCVYDILGDIETLLARI